VAGYQGTLLLGNVLSLSSQFTSFLDVLNISKAKRFVNNKKVTATRPLAWHSPGYREQAF
jgi:hypothetical protein